MSWFTYGAHNLYYEESGAGEPVLLLPGWGGTIEEFGVLRNALAARFRVIAADLPGSGRSEPQPREYEPGYLQQDAEVIRAFLEHLDAGKTHILGFSDGGEVALLLAASWPDGVASVATWGSAGQLRAPPGMLEAFAELIDAPIPPLAGFSEYLKAAYGEDNARIMVKSEARALTSMIEAGGDISLSRANQVKCQVLLIAGEHDPFAPPELVQVMADAIEHATFVEAKGCEHDVHNARPEWLGQILLDWVSQAGRGAIDSTGVAGSS
jgi:valacyclovir hydrolase